ncbi:MAG: DsbA family oxidoreductase [Cohaesibacter sp.]|jgi:predicted DsbA family dithiol-disulfide isomerase|nr:DsbA family oxidoreductase [Cohaesibacter sp.]
MTDIAASNADLSLDIISDIACPWCAIGYNRLRLALEETGLSASITWHPYEINPHLDYEGTNLIDNIIYKYQMSKQQVAEMRARLTGLGAEVGFTFAYNEDMRVQNSLRAHQLIHWAKQFGKSHEVKLALLEAFFTHRKNIADIEVLADLATRKGLDGEAAKTMLMADACLAEVKAAASLWQQRGIQGVPAVVAQSKYLLSGAQSVEACKAWLLEMAAKPA